MVYFSLRNRVKASVEEEWGLHLAIAGISHHIVCSTPLSEGLDMVAQRGGVALTAVSEGAVMIVEACFDWFSVSPLYVSSFLRLAPSLLLGRPCRSSSTVRSGGMLPFAGSCSLSV